MFDVNIVDVLEPQRLKNGNFIVGYYLTSGYAKGGREIYTTNANATNSFKLNLVYYKNSTELLSNETITIRASSFDRDNLTLADIGIDVNKYQPQYYNAGVASNLGLMDLTYDNLQQLQVLIINYVPTSYNITVNYFLDNGDGYYNEMLERIVSFTYPQLNGIQTIGQLVDIPTYRPVGYRGFTNYNLALNIENLLASSPISVFYERIANDRSKNVLVAYKLENDEGEYETFESVLVNVTESSLYDGSVLSDIISVEGYRPNPLYYNSGYIDNHPANDLITFETLETNYSVIYTKSTNIIYVEYYAGVYPNWYRLATTTLQTKYKTKFDTEFNVINDLNINLNKYHTAPYHDGVLYNSDNFNTYQDTLNTGVLQVYYQAIDYPITVNYYTHDLTSEPISETVYINALMFFGNPILSDIIPIASHRPEGYQFDPYFSYDGEISLDALTQASPIMIVYEEIQAAKTKNIIIRYKQELASTYSTITTNLITISEADIIGGTRLRDIINLNAYKPDYYEDGIIDGASSTAVINYEEIESSYDVLYVAATYGTPVRYYIDEVSDANWIGSSVIDYRVIDFTSNVSLYDFGLNLNMYKPVYTSDGELLYTGPINFSALLELESINVLYKTISEPEEDDKIDYPHRFLYLQHNDLGAYEYLHPEWTMNHAFINTGISADDMSKLTIVMECERVDQNVPLYQVNAGYGYLFGSYSALGAFYMRYNNQTLYGENLTGVNTYEAKAGATSTILTLTEDTAVGFGPNTGIYSSAQPGYSRAIFTYSHILATDKAQMPYPIYLFANNYNGVYANGLAGIGIYSCRIYYNDQLVRDFIPVQFYDKIGDQVAPSNCLYDKVTKTFFEDGSGLNSFNIKDDDRYLDTNLQHKIGYCYVNYYKGDEFIKTSAIYFRGDDFEGKDFDLYDKFLVDKNQPAYCKSGEIQNITSIDVSFDGLNNKTFTVYYEPITAIITVDYYQEVDGIEHKLQTEEIGLEEKDFYQVPTFGDLVRINKYKPEGYETDFTYTGSKVSLSRVVEGSPYKIVYKPIKDEIQTYTTEIIFQKKVFGVRQYEIIATKTLTFDQSNFRDGEYIDFYINKNEFKPEKYYVDGTTYQWYEMDERLNSPEQLKSSYTIVYMPETQFLDINYYTDEVSDSNLIASASWSLAIDELEPGYTYSIVDILPNSYVNKYKPVRCNGGLIQDATIEHTFETLMEQGVINIVYESLYEPDDPTQSHYEQKVLYWGNFSWRLFGIVEGCGFGGKIPYIDLGYRPKELGRLKIEAKAVAQSNGMIVGNIATGGFQDDGYAAWLGYTAVQGYKTLGTTTSTDSYNENLGNFYSHNIPEKRRGHFKFSSPIPEASGWVYSAEGPQFIDGQVYYTASSAAGVIAGEPKWKYYGTNATYRNGYETILDENYEEIKCYNEYGKTEKRTISSDWVVNSERCYFHGELNPIYAISNPVTSVLDAYNYYLTSYTEEDSNNAPYEIFENTDLDIFEARLQPKGSITLFRTRNPITGEMNIMPFNITTRAAHHGFPLALQGGNPYTGDYKQMEYEVLVQTGVDANNNPIYTSKVQYKNVKYADYPVPVYPQLQACAIWGIKIWDQDRLVRDLIPVAKGDKIYNYTMPENGLFDLVTEIFFGNSNEGGTYEMTTYFENENKGEGKPQLSLATRKITIKPEEVEPLQVMLDPCYYGKIVMNYYNYNYEFLGNQFVDIPTWYSVYNTTFEEIAGFNDMKPSDFHLNGFLDIDDPDNPIIGSPTLKEVYEMGSANVMYKLRTFTKTVIYYQGNYRVGSKDLMFSVKEIEEAKTLADLGIDVDLYWNENFAHGKVIFDESIIAEDDIQAFIDAPSPIIVYDKLTKDEAPNLFYVEYYRGGAYDNNLITPDLENENYLNCDLDGVILNPNGAIKYYNHYHSALYEDEVFDYFIPYQVKVLNKYVGIHRGPARKFPTLATIVDTPILTIIEERNGWGRLKEYPVGWIMLNAVEPVVGPGQNPDYDVPDSDTATIPFATGVHISKLTIDRLWCYIPEVESWVKAEDISYNQSGKLYNALGIDVIDLNQIDFTNVVTLYDLGILPNKKSLYFHDRVDFTWDKDFTYEAFSNQHELEFVYLETIYNYTCKYYKDNIDGEELGRAAFSCSIGDWNPDWDTFIATSWRVDENGQDINPSLYRDTELTLTWDYFGFEKNLFRPEGYPDGLYLWNPRSWDHGEVYFNFGELVRTGSQTVLYPSVPLNQFKIASSSAITLGTSLGIQPNLKAYAEDDTVENQYDIDYVFDPSVASSYKMAYNFSYTRGFNQGSIYYDNGAIYNKDRGVGVSVGCNYGKGDYSGTDNFKPVHYRMDLFSGMSKYSNLKYKAKGDYFTVNISAYRSENSFVFGQGNHKTGQKEKYYLSDGTQIYNNTKLAGNYGFTHFDNLYKDYAHIGTSTSGGATYTYYTKYFAQMAPIQIPGSSIGSGLSLAIYEYFLMKHYWIPVPKGYWYVFNGQDLRFENNGWYDLITGDFKPVENSTIYLLNQTVGEDEIYDYFKNWYYHSFDTDYIVKINTSTNTYHQPDLYAINVNTLTSGLVLPISKATSDSENRVVGEWYYSSNQWFESKNASIHAGSFDKTKLTKLKTQIFLVAPQSSETYYVYLDPSEVATPGESSAASYSASATLLTAYYNYVDTNGNKFYFDGRYWIPEKYTSLNTTLSNKNYAVIPDHLPYYQHPSVDDNYEIGSYHYGERVTILYVSTQNPTWGYTGLGWVQITSGTLSEVV